MELTVNDTANLVKIEWPDTKFIEEGYIQEDHDEEILFHSLFDGTVNWVPKQYIKK